MHSGREVQPLTKVPRYLHVCAWGLCLCALLACVLCFHGYSDLPWRYLGNKCRFSLALEGGGGEVLGGTVCLKALLKLLWPYGSKQIGITYLTWWPAIDTKMERLWWKNPKARWNWFWQLAWEKEHSFGGKRTQVSIQNSPLTSCVLQQLKKKKKIS